ncbi:MAG: hypothetical protein ABI091_02635 [Ferruginibacter sp.]
MKTSFLFLCAIFIGNYTFSQAVIDTTTMKPIEVTYFDGPANTVFDPGFLLRTRSKNYFEIAGKLKEQNKKANPEVKVYKQKRKYILVIDGLEQPLYANKLEDVTESNIDGDFRGWDGTTSWKLTNGDVWVQDEIKTLFSAAIFRPVVYIYRASDGTYKMKIVGVNETLQVKKK